MQSCLRGSRLDPVLASDAVDSRRDMFILPGVPTPSENPNDSRRCSAESQLSPGQKVCIFKMHMPENPSDCLQCVIVVHVEAKS